MTLSIQSRWAAFSLLTDCECNFSSLFLGQKSSSFPLIFILIPGKGIKERQLFLYDLIVTVVTLRTQDYVLKILSYTDEFF